MDKRKVFCYSKWFRLRNGEDCNCACCAFHSRCEECSFGDTEGTIHG